MPMAVAMLQLRLSASRQHRRCTAVLYLIWTLPDILLLHHALF
jgi:hypothetical protein